MTTAATIIGCLLILTCGFVLIYMLRTMAAARREMKWLSNPSPPLIGGIATPAVHVVGLLIGIYLVAWGTTDVFG